MPENRYWIQEDSLNVNTHKQAVLTRLLYEMPEKIYGVYIGIYWFWKIIFFKLCMHHVESCVMIVQPKYLYQQTWRPATEWCTCKHCQDQQTIDHCVCHCNYAASLWLDDSLKCITQHPGIYSTSLIRSCIQQ